MEKGCLPERSLSQCSCMPVADKHVTRHALCWFSSHNGKLLNCYRMGRTSKSKASNSPHGAAKLDGIPATVQGRNINYYQTILPVSFSTAACVFVRVCRPVCIDIFISIPYTGIRALSQTTAFPFKRHILPMLCTWTRGLAIPGESQQWDMATCQGCFGEGLLEFALFHSQAPHIGRAPGLSHESRLIPAI